MSGAFSYLMFRKYLEAVSLLLVFECFSRTMNDVGEMNKISGKLTTYFYIMTGAIP